MLLFVTALSTTVYAIFHFVNFRNIALPFLPIATVGTAVAFYVGFKNNSSYDRLWEGRKIWGELTNTSRAFAAYFLAVSSDLDKEEITKFVYRQIAYVNILRLQLRRRNVWDNSDDYTRMSQECFRTDSFEAQGREVLRQFCPSSDPDQMLGLKNIATEIAFSQMHELARLKKEKVLDEYEASDLMRMIQDIFNSQGKAERIKSFPFPRQYAFFSEVFVYIFITLLPFGLVGEFAKIGGGHEWLTIPFSILISWIFFTMEKVGDTSENPFEASLNDVPMTAICRNIEIDLKSMLRETEIPDSLKPVDNILM